MAPFLKFFVSNAVVSFIKDFIGTRRRRTAEKIVDSVLEVLEKGAEKTKFSVLDDRIVRYMKAERETLIKLVEQQIEGVLK